jgi:hypothetical protein
MGRSHIYGGRRKIGGEKIIITTRKIEDWLCL